MGDGLGIRAMREFSGFLACHKFRLTIYRWDLQRYETIILGVSSHRLNWKCVNECFPLLDL